MESIILEELKELNTLIRQRTHKKYLDMRQMIDYTSLSGSTIRRAINKGELKASKTTGKLLFKTTDVDGWLNG